MVMKRAGGSEGVRKKNNKGRERKIGGEQKKAGEKEPSRTSKSQIGLLQVYGGWENKDWVRGGRFKRGEGGKNSVLPLSDLREESEEGGERKSKGRGRAKGRAGGSPQPRVVTGGIRSRGEQGDGRGAYLRISRNAKKRLAKTGRRGREF